jgi:hypothetical protein
MQLHVVVVVARVEDSVVVAVTLIADTNVAMSSSHNAMINATMSRAGISPAAIEVDTVDVVTRGIASLMVMVPGLYAKCVARKATLP